MRSHDIWPYGDSWFSHDCLKNNCTWDIIKGSLPNKKCHKLWKKSIRGVGGQSQNQNSLHFKCRLLWLEGGVWIFHIFPNLNYFAIILQFCLYKKCLKFKNVPIWSEGGVNIFQNCPKFKNVPKVGGGRVNSNWEIDPNFLDIQFWRLPLFYLIEA